MTSDHECFHGLSVDWARSDCCEKKTHTSRSQLLMIYTSLNAPLSSQEHDRQKRDFADDHAAISIIEHKEY